MINRKEKPELLSLEKVTKERPFVIRTIREIRETEDEESMEAHRHPHFELICVTKGGGKIRVDFQKLELENYRVYCIAAGQVHQFLPDRDAEGFSISFSEFFAESAEYDPDMGYSGHFFQLFKNAGSILVTGEVQKDLEIIMKKLCQEFNNVYPFKLQMIKRYLRILLIYLGRHVQKDTCAGIYTRDKVLVQEFLVLVDRHFKKAKMVADYAKRLSITPNYLNEMVKRNTGHPAGEHIRQRIAMEAKRMALYSHNSMKEIAYSLGFSDSAHFSRFFKMVTGKNFSNFKREQDLSKVA